MAHDMVVYLLDNLTLMNYQRYLFVMIHGRWFYWTDHKKMMEEIENTVYPELDPNSKFIH